MPSFGRTPRYTTQWLAHKSSPTRNFGSPLSRCGITCLSIVAFAACSASAFVVLTNKETGAERQLAQASKPIFLARGSWFWYRPPNLNHRLQCEALDTSSRAADETTSDSHHQSMSSMLEKKLANNDNYVLLKVPERALESSHVIYGQLLRENLIESYTTYKLSTVTRETTRGEVVVASVKLGTALDGHKNVVHGGILALLIDDILGFGYEALEVPAAVTANLNVNYRAAVPAGCHILVSATLEERKERKLTWSVRVESPDQQTLYCEATSVFVIPRQTYE
jgi:acyl-coenzyme A thioesterase PaaI-like protein